MKTFKPVTIFTFIMLVLFAACEKDDFIDTIGICPLVVSTNPDDGAINVPLSQVITVTFNEEMNPATITDASIIIEAGTAIAGTVTYSGFTATFTPAAPLEIATTYTGRVKTTVKDVDGNALQQEYVWSFSTGATVSPIVIATDPIDTETDVVLNKIITATFSQQMDPLTIDGASFFIMDGTTAVNGVVTYNGVTATFTPSSDLDPSTLYTATITTNVTNTTGMPLVNDYVWSFTTGTIISPTVISTDPADNEIDVILNKTITATFSETMDGLTIDATSFTLESSGTPVTGAISYSGTTALFNPTTDLLPNTVYTATITTDAANTTGIPLANDYIWEFTTGNVVAPTVLSTDPEDNEINVVLDKIITATFDQPMDPNTIDDTTFILMEGTNSVTGTVSYGAVTASFEPSVDLLPNTIYTATITTGATNVGGVPLTSDYEWEFTTEVEQVNLPDMGTIENFGGFGGNAGMTNQGLNTVINNGGIGTTAASTLVTGFHDGLTGDIYTETPLNVGLVTGGIFTAPPAPGTATSFALAQQALLDAQDLYNAISPAAMPGGSDPGAGELGGLVLPPGVYQSASGTFNISNGDLTLDAQGDPNALWVFQTASGLTVGIAGPTGAKSVILVNGADENNVFWQVGSAATINAAGGGVMVGTIVSMQGVTLSTAGNAVQTVLNGRAISLVASVTMVNTTINVPN